MQQNQKKSGSGIKNVCEKIFELICLAAGHSLLADMDPDSAFDLMLYFEFHIIFPRMFVNKKHLQ